MPKKVDAHAHFLPPPYVEALLGRSAAPRMFRDGEELILDFGAGGQFPLHSEIVDLERHLEGMSAGGVDAEVLTLIPPGVEGLEPSEAREVAAAANDWLADLCASRPEQLRAVAVLPASQPEAAAEELRRSASRGLVGGSLLTNVAGARLDEDRFLLILDAAAELDVPIVLHPAPPQVPDPFVELGLMTTVGFPVETTVAVVRLVLKGLFDRHPGFKLLAPHVGATIPFLLGRIDYEWERYRMGSISEPPSEHLRRVYLDSVAPAPGPIRLATELWGEERVLFGTDTPFWDRSRCMQALEQCSLDEAAREKIYGVNAERLFASAA
jgi:predicted TIM-barrel fold metal-dependent hydrolase